MSMPPDKKQIPIVAVMIMSLPILTVPLFFLLSPLLWPDPLHPPATATGTQMQDYTTVVAQVYGMRAIGGDVAMITMVIVCVIVSGIVAARSSQQTTEKS